MKNKPLISVIVTTSNRKKLLKETIDSILNQTFKEFELIVIDNYSDYDFFKLINSFNDKRIAPFQNHNNGIIAVNRNFGIKKAKGEYIAFCDDDDLWFPDKLIEILHCFSIDKSIGMVTSKEVIIDELSNDTGRTTQEWINESQFLTYRDLFLKNAGSPSATIIKKACITDVGYFDESAIMNRVEDYDFWLRFVLKHRLYYLNKMLGGFRVHSSSASILDDKQLLNAHRILLKSFKDQKREVYSFKKEAKKRIRKDKLRIAFYYFKHFKVLKTFIWTLNSIFWHEPRELKSRAIRNSWH